ncbi:hypothetical protein M408DRAFT_329034 [Serendipita vermifera MAFF 305830]|uniref:PNPLA domain-containing protein n=1 Tax=Serendipita vermifera MAFF 305830 TaxID=933852 RepID=A0A0C2XIU4_SERVB|nr:hypothetical protein M408DRAFT_329034 [Serendipita vermifera MAFF 305830]
MSGIKEETDGLCILSFDSGGPGTYSQLLILKEYMSRLASDLTVAEDDVYPADYFDLMGGVGFGGLVAFMLGYLRMNVNQAIDEVLTLTDLLSFNKSNGDIDREINSNSLKESLENMLQARRIALETKMKDTDSLHQKPKVVLYAASTANITHPHAFRTYPARGSNLDPTMVEALCATTAIQSHFLPIKVGPPRLQKSFIGGALGANNPTRLLLEEASSIYGKHRRVAQILSLGCGLPQVLSIHHSDKPDPDRMLKEMTADCEAVANELSTRLLNIDAYIRLNVNRGMEMVRMEGWNDLGAVETHTASYLTIAFVSESIDTSLRYLQNRAGTITLSQINHSSSIKVVAKKAPSVSPYLVLRKKPWETMVNYLVSSTGSRQKIFPITGMGGCGKTQLVSYFLQEYPNLYAQTVYVDASSSSSIKADFQTWARTLGGGHERDAWEDAIRTLSDVTQGEQWALVLDNVDDPTLDLIPFLPKHVHLTILITSRNRNLGNLSTTYHLELGEMDVEEAMTALLQAARRQLPLSEQEIYSAQNLLKELGCLAVALVQAGTYCYQFSSTTQGVFRPYTFSQYLSLFNSRRAELMKKDGPTSLDNYQRGVYATLDLSYKALPQESRDFLHFISFFHHTDIPLAAFAKAASNGFEDPFAYLARPQDHQAIKSELRDLLCTDAEWNELRVQGLVHTLRSFSLVTASSIDDLLFLQLHPLIQTWSRDMDSVTSQRYQAMTIQVLTACGSEKNFRLNRHLLPHILDIISRIDLHDLHVNDLVAYGAVHKQQGQYHKAGKLFRKSLAIAKNSAQPSSINILRITLWLANNCWKEGRWRDAEKLQVEVLGEWRQVLGMENEDTIQAAESLAFTYHGQGRWAEAENLRMEVLEQRRRILGTEHPNTIPAAANLATTYNIQGRWAEAEKLRIEVLEQWRRILGTEHPDTILAAGNLASTYLSQGRWIEAGKLFAEVLDQCKRILGLEHPDTIFAAGNLAATFHAQGQWTQAEKLFVEVLEQRRRVLGIEHPDTIFAAANLAATYGAQGRWDDDATLLAPTVRLSLDILGREHPRTREYVHSLASVYEKLGKYKEAEETIGFLLSD